MIYFWHDEWHPDRRNLDETKPSVFILFWLSFDMRGEMIEGFERDDCSLIGIYSSRAKAEAALSRAKLLPGFCDAPEYFLIDEYALDEDHWTQGFEYRD